MKRMQIFLAGMVFLGIGLSGSGPASAWDLTGKEQIAELQAQNAKLYAQTVQQQETIAQNQTAITQLNEQEQQLIAENEQLRAKISQLEAQVGDLLGQIDEKGDALAACRETLAVEAKRGTGIKVIFFGGDIIYEVVTDAFLEYRAGLRYRSLRDREFAEKLQSYEQGNGGDLEVLAVLKEMDLTKDRLIEMEEAQAFRKNEETR